MKRLFYFCYLILVLSGAFTLVTSCSSDDIEESIPLQEAPSDISLFVKSRFPGAMINCLSCLNDGSNGYRILLSNSVEACFDENGAWTKVVFPDASTQLFARKFLKDKYDFMESRFGEIFVSAISATHEGESVELSDGRKLAFDTFDSTPLGYEYTDRVAEEQMPASVRAWILKAFPQGEVTRVVVASDLADASSSAYRIWIDEKYLVLFDVEGNWNLISGEFEHEGLDEEGYLRYLELPVTVLDNLPQKIMERVRENYPEARITSVRRDVKENYTLQIDSNLFFSMSGGDREFVLNINRIQEFVRVYFPAVHEMKMAWNFDYGNPNITVSLLNNGFSFLLDGDYEWLRMSGNGQIFPELILASLPEGIVSYWRDTAGDVGITDVDRSDGNYRIGLVDGTCWLFTSSGEFIGYERKNK